MKELTEALGDLEETKVYELVDKYVAEGQPVLEIIDALNAGMVAVGERFSENIYFISQLMFSAEILKGVMEKLDPLLQGEPSRDNSKKIVLGTVKGDIHDIGKNIVATLMRGSGFEVIDLGVDVPPEKFVEAVQESGAKILAMSALLNFTYPEMKTVVDTLDAAGLKGDVKTIIGGAPVNEQVRQFCGADYVADDAVHGVKICKEILGE
jgi:methylmalonyl-CoA mutase cobalamin-binding domain/chain